MSQIQGVSSTTLVLESIATSGHATSAADIAAEICFKANIKNKPCAKLRTLVDQENADIDYYSGETSWHVLVNIAI